MRSELRSLGYLEDPFSRFFAGGLTGRHPAMRTHLRVGVGVGIALGLASALLTAPVLLASPGRVAPWLAVALLAFSFVVGVLIGVFAAGAMFLVYRLTRNVLDRAELVARSTSVAVFILAFVYLLSFWRRYGTAFAPQGGGVTRVLAALCVVVVAFFVSRLFYLASFAVLATIRGYEFAPRRSGARRAFASGVVLAAVAAYLGARAQPSDATPEFAEKGDAITVETPLASRVVLLALDGIDATNAAAAIAHGWMPNLARLAAEGYSAEVAAAAGDIPPAYWTTVTTGFESKRHRIDAYYKPRVAGMSPGLAADLEAPGILDTIVSLARVLGLAKEVPVSGSMSRLKRLADVAAEGGLQVASVNFWATYPASAFGGTTISDWAYLTLRPSVARGSAIDPECASPGQIERLKSFLYPDERVVEMVPSVGEAGLAHNFVTIYPILEDLFAESAALDLLAREKPAYQQICLKGLDVLRNKFFHRERAKDDVRLVAQSAILRGVYASLDDFIGRLREAAGKDAILVIVTCPGASGNSADAAGGSEDGESRGYVVLHGPAIRVARAAAPLPSHAIAPTLQFALGLPVSREQDGRATEEPFTAQALESASAGGANARSPRMVDSFGLKRWIDAPDGSSQEALRILEALGYL